jgi:hypothetical protein
MEFVANRLELIEQVLSKPQPSKSGTDDEPTMA